MQVLIHPEMMLSAVLSVLVFMRLQRFHRQFTLELKRVMYHMESRISRYISGLCALRRCLSGRRFSLSMRCARGAEGQPGMAKLSVSVESLHPPSGLEASWVMTEVQPQRRRAIP